MSHSEVSVPNPWERFGWLLGSVWLVFLSFPLVAVWDSGASVPIRILLTTMIVAFAVIYMWGLKRLYANPPCSQRSAWAIFAVLAVLTVLTAPVISFNALGLAFFLISYSIFAFPWRHNIPIVATLLAVMFASGPLSGAGTTWMFMGLIGLGVTAAAAGSRIASERGEAYEQARRSLAQVRERERVARDVHDVLGHTLTVISAKSELAERLLDSDPDRARAELHDIHRLARESIAEVRSTVGGLRSRQLVDEVDAARSALDAAGISHQIDMNVLDVDPGLRAMFAWVLREGITNVIRHSRAETCTVTASQSELSVSDDGVGYAGKPGHGLRGLTERVAEAGGTLTIEPRPDGGTVLTVRMVHS